LFTDAEASGDRSVAAALQDLDREFSLAPGEGKMVQGMVH
jgi:hypothetical protein